MPNEIDIRLNTYLKEGPCSCEESLYLRAVLAEIRGLCKDSDGYIMIEREKLETLLDKVK
jgi:hypothetical protein